jgi:hypothetical protein
LLLGDGELPAGLHFHDGFLLSRFDHADAQMAGKRVRGPKKDGFLLSQE